jgi:hypothetical protein
MRGLRFEIVATAPLRTTVTLTTGRRVLARRRLALHAGAQRVRLAVARPPRARRFVVTLSAGGSKRHLHVG